MEIKIKKGILKILLECNQKLCIYNKYGECKEPENVEIDYRGNCSHRDFDKKKDA